ncbi:MAG: hypothetical protein RL213_157 [Bacteroidota bacterium]|jgi:hypothetical protein
MLPDLRTYLDRSVNYTEFRKRFEKHVDAIANATVADEHADYYRLNWQRSVRNEKTFRADPETLESLAGIKGNIIWLVITEPWCGDSAQSLAALHALAEASGGKIDLRIFYRDSDTTLIDAFLTNGSRSIPKLIQLNAELEVTGTWGPRPQAAQELVLRLKSDPSTAANYGESLHKWYAEDKTRSLQEELRLLLGKS